MPLASSSSAKNTVPTCSSRSRADSSSLWQRSTISIFGLSWRAVSAICRTLSRSGVATTSMAMPVMAGAAAGLGIAPLLLMTTAALAAFGVLAAQALQNWVMVLDWPMNFGGKPFFSWPAFVPITFEAMVFFGAIGSAVIAILAGKRDTVPQPPPMAIRTGATVDRFVLWISATDPRYDAARALDFARSLGAHEVRVVDATGGDDD